VEILIIVVFVLLIVAGGIFSHRQAAKRRQALAETAARQGWTFAADNDSSLSAHFGSLKCLDQGSNRYAYNVMRGNYRQHPVYAFDYHYETYSTDSKGNTTTHHHQFSVTVLETDLPLKPLLIRPEGVFDIIGEFFGFDDIDFESSEFSRAFHVSSSDRRWAFDVIHQTTMEFLLAAPRFTIEIAGARVVSYRDSCFDPPEFEAALGVAAGIVERLPNYLLREWKGAVR
jgi:hypothetical protein